MNLNQQHLDSEILSESEQNGIVLQEFDEEKQRKQQEEIDYMKLRDSKDNEERIKHLTKLIKDRAEEEEPEIEQRVIDLFNQLKKEQDREEYLREYVKNYLDKTGSSYNPKEIRNLVAKYIRNCMKEDLDFENNVAWFNSSIQNLKQDIEKLIQTYMHEKMPCEL